MAMITMTTEPCAHLAEDLALARLLQLGSVSLPVGGFAFSQGLEFAVECTWVTNAAQVHEWLSLQLRENLARVEVPVLREAMIASAAADWDGFSRLNDRVLASRETHELRLTDTAMGEALRRLLGSLDFALPFLSRPQQEASASEQQWSFVCLFGYAASHWQIPYRQAAIGFLWSWLEGQVAAATKLVPLGQTQAQQLLVALQPNLTHALSLAQGIGMEEIGAGLPALALASAWHETQYTRLFRS